MTSGIEDYERNWFGRFVDKNLKDEWLEKLNNLQTFDLISICEGHQYRTGQQDFSRPNINLKCKTLYTIKLLEIWPGLKIDFREKMESIFNMDFIHIDYQISQSFSLDIKPYYSVNHKENFSLYLTCSRKRVSIAIDTITSDWFDEVVKRIIELDKYILEL